MAHIEFLRAPIFISATHRVLQDALHPLKYKE